MFVLLNIVQFLETFVFLERFVVLKMYGTSIPLA